jgi:hypothetical protein
MRVQITALALAFALLFPTQCMATEKLLPLSDPSINVRAPIGKQATLVFSDALRAKYFPEGTYAGLVISEINDTQICFNSDGDKLNSDDAKFKAIARVESSDICVMRSEVSAKYDSQDVAGATPQPFYVSSVANCKSVWKTGKGIGLWAEDCNFGDEHWAVNYTEADDDFVLGNGNTADDVAVIRQFHKQAGDGPDALLPELRAKKFIPDDDECKFEVSKDETKIPHMTIYDIMPTGKRKAEFDKAPQDEIPDPPCGDLGLAVDFQAYFMIDDRMPDRVLYLNEGQDVPMFDPYSIKLD